MNKAFQRAKLQGALGALCLLIASATYFLSDEAAYSEIVRVLAWLLAFTFLHYALANIQNITGSQVFTIFKYAYNIAVLVLLGYVAVYLFSKTHHDQLLAFEPFLVLAMKVVWIIINFKLRAATGCKLFAVYAAILIAGIGANILYGMLQVLAPELITASVVKYMALANLILNPLASVVLLLAWLNMKTPAESKGSMEPGAEIKFARVYTRAEFKFRLRRGVCKDKISRCLRCFGKDTVAVRLRSTSFGLYRRYPRYEI